MDWCFLVVFCILLGMGDVFCVCLEYCILVCVYGKWYFVLYCISLGIEVVFCIRMSYGWLGYCIWV